MQTSYQIYRPRIAEQHNLFQFRFRVTEKQLLQHYEILSIEYLSEKRMF